MIAAVVALALASTRGNPPARPLPVAVREHQLHRRRPSPGSAGVRRVPRPEDTTWPDQAPEAGELRSRLRPDRRSRRPSGGSPSAPAAATSGRSASTRPTSARRSPTAGRSTSGPIRCMSATPASRAATGPRRASASGSPARATSSTASGRSMRDLGDHLDRRHQPAGHPAGAGVAEDRPRRGRQPDAGARRRVRGEVGHPAGLRLLRGAARRPGDRGRLHLAAEHDAHRVVDQVGRGRQARALREAVHAEPGRRHRGLGRGRPRGPDPVRGVHVPAQPADQAPPRADRRGRDRRGAPDPRRRSRTRSTTRTTSACAPTSRAAR